MSKASSKSPVYADAQLLLAFFKKYLAKPEMQRSLMQGYAVALGLQLLCFESSLGMRRGCAALYYLKRCGALIESSAGYYSLPRAAS